MDGYGWIWMDIDDTNSNHLKSQLKFSVIPLELESEFGACVAKVLTHFFNMESELRVWSLEQLEDLEERRTAFHAFHLA